MQAVDFNSDMGEGFGPWTIGDGVVIGANSLVLKDVAAGSKAFGTPCRVVERT